jgi:general stress protein 26
MIQSELKKIIVSFFKTYPYSTLITVEPSGMPKARSMENLPFGNDLVCWFGTGADSAKVRDIKVNPMVSVFMYRPEDHSSLCLQGKAAVVTDIAERKAKWNDKWSIYWPDGPSNENFTLIKIISSKITYLDWPNRKSECLEL